jgi:spore germination protein (amino acid permease)
MLKEGKFGPFETMWLLVLFCCTKLILGFPRTMIMLGGSAGWMIPIISAIPVLLGFTIIVLLLKHFPGQSIIEAGTGAAGPIIGNIAATGYLVFFIVITAMVLREFAESIKIMTLPMTPLPVIVLSFFLAAVVCVYLGLEVCARLSVVIAIPMLAVIVLIVILICREYNFNYLFPLLGKGPQKLLLWGMIKCSNYSEIIFAGLVINSIGGWQQTFKTGIKAIFLSILVSAMITAVIIMTFNSQMAEEFYLPLFRLTKEITIGRFFQRVEAVFIIIWTLVGLLYCTLGLYAATAIFARMLNASDYKPLVPAMAMIILTVAFLPHDMKAAVVLDSEIIRVYSWLISFAVPLIILLIAVIKGYKPKFKRK